jgi:DNA-binding transcriptional regulator YiaG
VTTALLDFTTGELSEASAAVTSVATVQEWEQVTAALQAKAP